MFQLISLFYFAGLLHDGVGFVVDILCCRFKIGKYGDTKSIPVTEPLVLGGDTETLNQYTALPASNTLHNTDSSFNPVDLVTDSYNTDIGKQNGLNSTGSER